MVSKMLFSAGKLIANESDERKRESDAAAVCSAIRRVGDKVYAAGCCCWYFFFLYNNFIFQNAYRFTEMT